MKIGYINILSPNPLRGTTGRTIHIQEVCKAWRKMGHEVFIITVNPLNISADVKIYNLEVPTHLFFDRYRRKIISVLLSVYQKLKGNNTVAINTKVEMKISSNVSSNNFTKLSWSPRVLYRDIARIINEFKYDNYLYNNSKKIIESEKPDFLYNRLYFGESTGVKLSKKYNLPLIIEFNASCTFPNEWDTNHTYFYKLVKKKMENSVCRQADAVVVVTSFIKKYLVGENVSLDRIFVNPNGVNLSQYYESDSFRKKVRKQYGLNNKIVVGFLGNFRPWHDVDVFVNGAKIVLSKVPRAHFLFVGDGPSRHKIEKMTNTNGMGRCVTFTGNIPNEEVVGHINAMDIAVAPISRGPYFHGSPVKIFEYLAVGKPVVVSRFPVIESIIFDHKNGLLVEPGDKIRLANAILELIKDKSLREQLGREGRRSVEAHYSWQRNATKILDIYRNIQDRALS